MQPPKDFLVRWRDRSRRLTPVNRVIEHPVGRQLPILEILRLIPKSFQEIAGHRELCPTVSYPIVWRAGVSEQGMTFQSER